MPYKKYDLDEKDTTSFMISIQKMRTTNKTYMKLPHKHSHYEIVNLQSSNTDDCFFINNFKYSITPNTVFLFPPHIKHRSLHVPCTHLLINMRSEYALPVFDFLGINIDLFFRNTALAFSDQQTKEMYKLAEKMIAVFDITQNPLTNYQLRLMTANFINILNHPKYIVEPENINGSTIEKVEDYLKNNYWQPITLDALADKFFINKFILCKEFKKLTGTTITSFLTLVRINHARDLLENSNMPIEEIAKSLGYNSSQYFSIAFKKNIGISPINYRLKYTK